MIPLTERPIVQVPVTQAQQGATPATVQQQQNVQAMGRKTLLTNEEFDNLKRSIQLLRIEQIRYIVQRFSLPANGNKTRLIQIILGIIDTLRPTPLLVDMSIEVNRLLQQQHEPFSNPLDSTHKMVPYKDSEPLFTPSHPFFKITNKPPVLGPLYAAIGNSTLHPMTVDIGDFKNLYIEFSWKCESASPFDMVAHVNGTTIVISSEDPIPQPIDISDLIQPPVTQITFDVQTLRTPVPMAITIREYELQTLSSIAESMAKAAEVSTPAENLQIKGKDCSHSEGFLLMDYLSHFYSLKDNTCPICKNPIDLDSIVFVEK